MVGLYWRHAKRVGVVRPNPAPIRKTGIHPWARVGGRPEAREWIEDRDRSWFPPSVNSSACICAYASVDGGCEGPTYIGARVLVMQRAHVGHDCHIAADCEIGTNAVIGGFARIGQGVKIGINATVLPFRKVGAGAVVGGGSVVTKDIPVGETWCGNPARRIDPNPTPFSEREPESQNMTEAIMRALKP